MSARGWIAVDLDGTLAHYDEWRGAEHIGEPIAPMVERVKAWLAEGREVRIFTARVYCAPGDAARALEIARVEFHITEWCKRHIGVALPITCTKDFSMRDLWDDRAVQVIPNTGMRADGAP